MSYAIITTLNLAVLLGSWLLRRTAYRVFDMAAENNREARAIGNDADVIFNRSQLLRDEARRYYDSINERQS